MVVVYHSNGICSKGGKGLFSGFDGIFPPGIAVGEIVTILPTEELFKDIKVRPYFEFRHLDQLAVIMIESKEIY